MSYWVKYVSVIDHTNLNGKGKLVQLDCVTLVIRNNTTENLSIRKLRDFGIILMG